MLIFARTNFRETLANYEFNRPTKTTYIAESELRTTNYIAESELRTTNYIAESEPRTTNYIAESGPRTTNYITEGEPRTTNCIVFFNNTIPSLSHGTMTTSDVIILRWRSQWKLRVRRAT